MASRLDKESLKTVLGFLTVRKDGAPPRTRRDASGAAIGVLGSGLGAAPLTTIFVVSVLVFLFWGGPLWSAPRGASHVWRIAASYLLAVPLVATALALSKRWSAVRLASSVALIWSAKLVTTATLYSLFVAGAPEAYEPAPVHKQAPSAAPLEAPRAYRPLPAPDGLVGLAGRVTESGRPVVRAAIVLDKPSPGLQLPASREVRITIGGAGRSATTTTATTQDRIVAVSGDSQLHTLRLLRDGQSVLNIPLPPQSTPAPLAISEPGTYEWTCGVHAAERGTVVVVDHPYAASTDDSGKFELRGVPAGTAVLLVVRDGRPVARHDVRAPSTNVEITLETEKK